jgi:hypothetical protein
MARTALKAKQWKMFEKRFVKGQRLKQPTNIIIDVDCVEDLNHMLEILVFVEFVWEHMLEKD